MSPVSPIAGAVRIEPFRPAWAEAFRRLNLQWLERYFSVEPIDLPILSDPKTQVIDCGGQILFAVDGADVVLGICALLARPDGAYELSKMSVDECRQGQGIGARLIEAAIDEFRRRGGTLLFLETSSRLTPALHLYRRMGFVEREPPHASHYRRADVYMVWRPAGAAR